MLKLSPGQRLEPMLVAGEPRRDVERKLTSKPYQSNRGLEVDKDSRESYLSTA